MLKTLIEAYLMATQSEDVADKFAESFDNSDFTSIENEDLTAIETAIGELLGSELLSRAALKELSNYKKAMYFEIKDRENSYF
jgi:hypothetical protein